MNNLNNVLEKDLLSKRIILVDGITRTGKALLSQLLLGLKDTSSVQFLPILDQLMPLYINNHINTNAMSSCIRLYLNENLYNYMLSRNLNFRYDDLSSIHRTHNSSVFFKNLNNRDGDEALIRLKNYNTLFHFQTHHILSYYSYFLKLNLNIEIVELFRHPIDTSHSWFMRGWGHRLDNDDPRCGATLFKYNDIIVPSFAIEHEEYYIGLNEMEKCIFMNLLVIKKSIAEYIKLTKKEKKKILILKYEDLLNNPEHEINKICLFFDTERIAHMETVKKEIRVPRIIDLSKRNEKLQDIKSQVNKKLYDELTELVKDYEENFYGLS